MFRLTEILAPDAILCGCQIPSRDLLLDEMVSVAAKAYGWTDGSEIARLVRRRELLMSTAIGLGIAVPHARIETPNRVQIAAACLPNGLDFAAPDRRPVRLVLLLVSSVAAPAVHVQALAAVSRISQALVDSLVLAATPGIFLEVLSAWEATISK